MSRDISIHQSYQSALPAVDHLLDCCCRPLSAVRPLGSRSGWQSERKLRLEAVTIPRQTHPPHTDAQNLAD